MNLIRGPGTWRVDTGSGLVKFDRYHDPNLH